MSYKGYRQPHDPGVEFGPDAVVVDGDWLELEFVRRDEQVAALQAQLDAVRAEASRLSEVSEHWRGSDYIGGMEAAGDVVLDILDRLPSAPSDVLDRVKREAWDECLDAIELYELNTQQARLGNPYRTEATK